MGLAVPEDQIERTIYDAMIEESDGKPARISEIVWQIASDFDLAPSNIKLAGFEQVFAGRDGRELRTVAVYGDQLGVVLEPGQDQVVLQFEPSSFRSGVYVSLAGVVLNQTKSTMTQAIVSARKISAVAT